MVAQVEFQDNRRKLEKQWDFKRVSRSPVVVALTQLCQMPRREGNRKIGRAYTYKWGIHISGILETLL